MRRFLAALLALLLAGFPADAGTLLLLGAGVATPAAPAGYTGPGDVVASATAFYSCSRGYSAAYSTGSNKGCNLRRASDNTTQDINILSNGNFDTASANTFAGIDATCQGSTSGLSTTIAFTSCSATPKAADTVTGSGISQPEYLTACGSFVGGAGSCTLTTAQNIGVAETVTMQVALFATEVYDQSGNAKHVTQATAGNQPQWIPSLFTSLPGLIFNGSQWLTGSINSVSQPFTFSSVRERTGSFSSITTAIGWGQANSGWNNAANQVGGWCGSQQGATASDNVFHALQEVCNGASGVYSVDNTETTLNFGGNASDTTVALGENAGSQFVIGAILEGGLWPAGFSGAQRTNMCHNQFLYYGTATSC